MERKTEKTEGSPSLPSAIAGVTVASAIVVSTEPDSPRSSKNNESTFSQAMDAERRHGTACKPKQQTRFTRHLPREKLHSRIRADRNPRQTSCCLMLRSSSSRRVATGPLGVDGVCACPNRRKASETSVRGVASGASVRGVCPGRPRASRVISSVRPPSPPPRDIGTATCLRVHCHEIFQLVETCRCRIRTTQDILQAWICLKHSSNFIVSAWKSPK